VIAIVFSAVWSFIVHQRQHPAPAKSKLALPKGPDLLKRLTGEVIEVSEANGRTTEKNVTSVTSAITICS
jgi:hypothetical protein